MPSIFSKQQVAEMLGVSPRTVDTYRKTGLLDSIVVRGRVRFVPNELITFLQKHAESAA